jgi:N-acetylglucosaminyl-diphospho-decaprenol L-rhamnosyltransferase
MDVRTHGPALAAVVVTYNSAAVLTDCLRSLPDGFRGVHLVRVVVADNASTDASVAIAESFSTLPLTIVQVGFNAGYAAGVNAAVRELGTSGIAAVLVLNPDTQLRPGSVVPLAEALDVPGRGIAVPRLVNPDGTLQPSLCRRPTLARALAQALTGRHCPGKLRDPITDPKHYRRAGQAAWAMGAAMLVSMRMMRDIGPWDESFLLYSEEVEFALRAADHGWVLWYEPDAVVEHIGGESATNPMLAALLAVNRVRLFRARHGPLAGAAFFVVATTVELIRAIKGHHTARAAVIALLCPSRRITTLPGRETP